MQITTNKLAGTRDMNSPFKKTEAAQAFFVTQHDANLVENEQLNWAKLQVSHETFYQYDYPVNSSKNFLRLFPVTDNNQKILSHNISVSTDCHSEVFTDVFDNRVCFLEINKPFKELSIKMESVVIVAPVKPIIESKSFRQTYPLVWLPWQRQMMLSYLLPPELPEFQLSTLTEYALSFVEHNDYKIIDILNDINTTIYNEYMYVSGLTDLSTTPFELFQHRKGVCQDFANLFICLARLLNIPARYRSGYIYMGDNHENTFQSASSHAWVEVYLPWLGWLGYDPTNGYLASTDHIRMACGRNYFDAAPISGTVFASSGNREEMTINVKVETA